MRTDPTGMVTSWEYYGAADGHLRGYLKEIVTDVAGEALTESFSYNMAGHLTSYKDPKDQIATYEVNAFGQLVRETGPGASNIETLTRYDANNNIIQIDVENVESLVAGDTVITANAWFTTTFTYDLLNKLTSRTREVDSSNTQTEEFEYDDNENLSLVKGGESVNGNQANNTVGFVWDERDLQFNQIQAPGSSASSTTQFDYDDNGNLLTKSVGMEGSPRIFSYAFNGYDYLKHVTDPMGNILTHDFDEAGNVLRREWMGELVDDLSLSTNNQLLREVSYTWDDRERLEDVTTSFFQYGDQMPYPTSTSSIEYSSVNQVLARIDALSRRTEFFVDTVHRYDGTQDDLLNRSDVLEFDENSNPVTVRDLDISSFGAFPNSQLATTLLEYDELDRLRKSTDNAGNVTEFGYDSRGNLIQRIDANGVEKRFEFDGLNRMVTMVIDMNGGGASASDVNDIVTQQVWDDSSRLIAQVDDTGNTTRYAYDELNRQIIKRMADGTLFQIGMGAVWGAGPLTPDLTTFVSGYDVHGNILSTLDANGTEIACAYDANNRLVMRAITRASVAAGDLVDVLGTEFEDYIYDGLGRIVSAANDDSTVSRTYDSMDNLIEEEIKFSGDAIGQKTIRTYDKVGNETNCIYPGGRSVMTAFDALNRKSSINQTDDFHYLGRFLVEAREFAYQELSTSYEYDYLTGAIRTPTRVTHGGINSIYHSLDHLTWDGVGNKLTKQGQLVGDTKHAYQYDNAYRLIDSTVTVSSTGTAIRDTDYDLDGVHNRELVTETLLAGTPSLMSYTMNSGSPDFDSELNQYSTTPGDAREYDQNGNWIKKQDPITPSTLLATLSYDAFNRMVGYQENGGELHRYEYDCFGRRIAKIVDVGGASHNETRFLYGSRDNWHVIEEQDDQGATLATYVYGNGVDEIISMQRDVIGDPIAETYYYLLDEQNTVEALVTINAMGGGSTVQERYEYGDYGDPTILDDMGFEVPESALSNSYMFTGRRYDSETGLYFYRTRYMDPIAGRFTTRDTIGAWGDTLGRGNAIQYASSNPISRSDPSGRDSRDEILGSKTIALASHGAIRVTTWETQTENILHTVSGIMETLVYSAGCTVLCTLKMLGSKEGKLWKIATGKRRP